IYIKSPAAEALARRVARATGETLTEAVRASLEARWAALRANKPAGRRRREVEAILRRVHALPRLDDRSEDVILGYDDHGIPR
ncbi:MAG: type II toxin-antitoxin system VapB family antitoxin, partial [Terriglobales bacterium]